MRWNKQEADLLTKIWKQSSKNDIQQAFPNRTWQSIRKKAECLHLKRIRQPYCGCKRIEKEPDWLTGELLGDGHITPVGQYMHTAKHIEHLQLLESLFVTLNAPTKIWPSTTFDKRTQKTYKRYFLKTPCLFQTHREKWYPNGLKRVPPDITINNKVLFHWFIGDGSITNNMMFKLCTMGFQTKDIELLRNKLNPFGLATTRQNPGTIYIRRNPENKKIIKRITSKWKILECYQEKMKRLYLWQK